MTAASSGTTDDYSDDSSRPPSFRVTVACVVLLQQQQTVLHALVTILTVPLPSSCLKMNQICPHLYQHHLHPHIYKIDEAVDALLAGLGKIIFALKNMFSYVLI
ncbi:unnamed protein product [Victoria cruziana]